MIVEQLNNLMLFKSEWMAAFNWHNTYRPHVTYTLYIANWRKVYQGSSNNYVTLRWVDGVDDFVTLRYGNSAWMGGVQAVLLRNASAIFHFPKFSFAETKKA